MLVQPVLQSSVTDALTDRAVSSQTGESGAPGSYNRNNTRALTLDFISQIMNKTRVLQIQYGTIADCFRRLACGDSFADTWNASTWQMEIQKFAKSNAVHPHCFKIMSVSTPLGVQAIGQSGMFRNSSEEKRKAISQPFETLYYIVNFSKNIRRKIL